MEISEVPSYIRVTNSWREGTTGPLRPEDYWSYLSKEEREKVREYRLWLRLGKQEMAKRIGIGPDLYLNMEKEGIIKTFGTWRKAKIILGDILEVFPPVPWHSDPSSHESRAYNLFQMLMEKGLEERQAAAEVEYLTRLSRISPSFLAGVPERYKDVLRLWKAGKLDNA